MSLAHGHAEADRPEGQATFEMANLRSKQTGLPFVVWVSQRDGARHDVRVKVGYHAKTFPDHMGVYSLRPFAHVAGPALHTSDARQLNHWIDKNFDVLLAYWNADIEYTDEMMEQIKSV